MREGSRPEVRNALQRSSGELRRWPRDLVREMLLAELDSRPERRPLWLLLLSRFASEQDLELFRKHLEDLPPGVVDDVRQNLPAI